MSNTSDMLGVFVGINSETTHIVDECKAKISVLDQAKGAYVKATTNIDQNLHDQITPVNDTIYATRDAYDERIDVQECKSDLFWRLTGITSSLGGGGAGTQNTYTFTCTKLSTVYDKSASGISSFSAGAGATVGFSTNRVVRLQNDGSFYSYRLEEEGDKLIGIGSSLDTFYQPDNLHGLKLYNEPYARDQLDTFRASGIGTISVGSAATTNRMTILSPSNETKIKVGQLMTPSKSGFFATQFVTVTGVGTTAVDLSSYPFSGITTSKLVVVPYITVDALPISKIDAPLSDGTFVNMTFTQDPDTLSDSLAVGMEDNPYVDQSIEIMSYNQAGTGVRIEYNNSGISSGTRTWNKFLDGLTDPNGDIDDDGNTSIISEPPLGADKVYYRIGFDEKPILYPGGSDASEGDSLSLTETTRIIVGSGINVYSTLSACDDTELNEAISARNTAETNLANDSDFPKKISLSNSIKEKVNDEFNLRTWAYRMQIGKANDRKAGIDTFRSVIEESDFQDLMNG
tara:strand:- start:102 stop:1646 length:1545 start_codon:yes stop_codon:yes gene_type:complete